MAPDAIGGGTIKRLMELRTGGAPTLSVYLDLEAESLSTPAELDAQLSALNDEPSLIGAQVDIERVRQLLRAQPGLTRSARALAIFSRVQAGLLEVVRLPSEVEPSVVFDTVAWLEPLADMISFGNRGVAVLSGGTARLFRGGASALTEFAFLDLALGHERAQLGLQKPCDREEQDGFAAHVGRVAEQLLRAHRRRPFEHLVIVACDQPRRVIDASIDQQLRDVLRGIIDADLGRASTAEIMHVVTPMIEGAERAQERAALTMLEDSIGAERTVASGLDRALAMLQQRHVELLLIAEGARFTAGVCPLCGWVSTNRRSCKLDGTDLASVDGYAQAVELAEEQAWWCAMSSTQ